jgi:hypothetical protein
MNYAPTQPQIDFVRSLQDRLHLSDDWLDHYCQDHYGGPFAALDRAQVSHLLDELKGWKALPADLQRAMGQQDMFGGVS